MVPVTYVILLSANKPVQYVHTSLTKEVEMNETWTDGMDGMKICSIVETFY